jgi:hypothetical protein
MGDNLGLNGLSRRLQGYLLQIDEAEIVAHKADEPNAFVGFFDSQALTGKNGRDVDAFAIRAGASAGRDAEVAVVQRIGEVRQAVIGEGALTLAGRFIPSASLSREAVETRLLLKGIHAGRAVASFFNVRFMRS